MKIRDLFVADITRDIPPVVYFHENSPEKLASEVGEYIITGGYADGDPRSKRVKDGIHENLVRLLEEMHTEQSRKGGPGLPASWISGFYGSGKSSFAKLLGYALDGVALPDGKPLAEALLARDDSAKSGELRKAWAAFTADLNAISVVFDIGGVARDDEHIHAAVVRQVQKRLGYCSTSDLVADYELRLERDGQWDEFLDVAKETLSRKGKAKTWSEAKDDYQAEDHFSEVLHKLDEERYPDPMSWIDSRAGVSKTGLSVSEAVAAIQDMVKQRAPGRTLFIVIDEVSQYVHESEDRMLKLQSLVSELGQKLKGGAWLLVTGQQKLEDSAETVVLGKLKDRFPPHLRVHLGTTNIRDVIHRRLLKKKPEHEATLRERFDKHRSDLQLYAYKCEEITDEDFLEVYPMLPGHIDLLLRITTNLRSRSTRVQGDSHAIRGLLQLLGELFRAPSAGAASKGRGLADGEVGSLITIDAIYEVIGTALDADTQATLARIFDHCGRTGDDEAAQVAKAVALLELIQDDEPTTAELVGKCLYATMGQGSQKERVEQALERLRGESLLGYSEKHGYKIQSSAGQEWDKERSELPAPQDRRSAVIREVLGALLAEVDEVKLGSRKLPFVAYYSDGKQANDVRIEQRRRDGAVVTVDFRYVGTEEQRSEDWVPKSDAEPLRERLVWVVGDHGLTGDLAGRLVRSRGMVSQYAPRRESLTAQKKQLLIQEEALKDDLERQLRNSVADAFVHGTVYFRGGEHRAKDEGGSFATALGNLAGRLIEKLYPHFVDESVTPSELEQLLAHELSGPSSKFLDSTGSGGRGLGILALDAGRYQASCEGQVPQRILSHINAEQGASGNQLFAHFGGPPFGYAPDVVRACVLGLLRGGFVRIQPESGDVMTSVRDPDVQELFTKDRPFRKATIYPRQDEGVSARRRVQICKLFDEHFGTKLERDNDAIADAVYTHLAPKRETLREVETVLAQLPGKPALPKALDKLVEALTQCTRSRQVEPTVQAVSKNLDALRDGLQLLGIYHSELTHGADLVARLTKVAEVRDHMLAQLEDYGVDGDLTEPAEQLRKLLEGDRPWRVLSEVEPLAETIREQYRAVRRSLLDAQEKEAEAARERVKLRKGFEKLDPDQVHRVLRPIGEARWKTDDDAIYPDLVMLRDTFASKLEQGQEEADALLDHLLNPEQPIIRLDTHLRGREITTEAQLDAALSELRERIAKLIAEGKRVRLW